MDYEMKKIYLEYGSNTLESLNELSAKLCLPSMPLDYAQFLVATNGGVPKNRLLHYVENGLETSTEVLELFGVTHKDVYSTLLEHKKYSVGVIPDLFLQIGSDGLGNKICIDLYEDGYGEICIVDHHFNCEDDDKDHYDKKDFEGGFFRVSSTFTSFFTSLVYYEQFEKTYLDEICRGRNILALKKLLDAGLDPNTKSNKRSTLVEVCASHNNIEMLKLLNGFDASFKGALFNAIYSGCEEAALFIVENGLEERMSSTLDASWWLQFVAKKNMVKLGDFLIKKGADVNYVTENGLSILALVQKDLDCIDFKNLLLSHGAKYINTNW